MKQDVELFRKIMVTIEDAKEAVPFLKIDGYTNEQILYHCRCLEEAEYIQTVNPVFGDSRVPEIEAGNITMSGMRFLDEIRDESSWKKLKKKLADNNLMFSTLTQLIQSLSIIAPSLFK